MVPNLQRCHEDESRTEEDTWLSLQVWPAEGISDTEGWEYCKGLFGSCGVSVQAVPCLPGSQLYEQSMGFFRKHTELKLTGSSLFGSVVKHGGGVDKIWLENAILQEP
jgi:hypothetical protein